MPESHTELFIHLVWTTLRKTPSLTSEVRHDVYRIIHAQCKNLKVEILALNGTDDHVHLLVRMPATLPISIFAKQVKGGSSHYIRQQKNRPDFQWQEGYGAFTISRWDISKVRQYVQLQEEHHKNGTQKEYFEPI